MQSNDGPEKRRRNRRAVWLTVGISAFILIAATSVVVYKFVKEQDDSYTTFDWARVIRQAFGVEGSHPENATDNQTVFTRGVLAWVKGTAEASKDRHKEAVKLFEEALEHFEKYPGLSNPYALDCYGSLADSLQKLRRTDEVEKVLKQRIAAAQGFYGKEHRQVAETMRRLARFYRDEKRHADAAKTYRIAAAMDERGLGEDSEWVAGDIDGVADALSKMGDYGEAAKLYERSMNIWQKNYGADHVYVAWDAENVGHALYQGGSYSASIPFWKKAIAIVEKENGKSSSRYRRLLLWLTWAHYMNHDEKQASAVADELLSLSDATKRREDGLGNNESLSQMLTELHKYKDAQEVLEEMVATEERQKEPTQLMTYYRQLGDVAVLRDNLGEAQIYFNKALEAYEKRPGGSENTLRLTVLAYERALVRDHKTDEAVKLREKYSNLIDRAKSHDDTKNGDSVQIEDIIQAD